MVETEAVDKLFLELSQFTNATTEKEQALRRACAAALSAMERARLCLYGVGDVAADPEAAAMFACMSLLAKAEAKVRDALG